MKPNNKNISRAEQVRLRRMQQTAQRVTLTRKTVFRPETVFLPVTPRPSKPARLPGRKAGWQSVKKSRKHYDIAFTMGRTNVRAPAIALPQLGPRLISALLCAGLLFAFYILFNSSTFLVNAAEISGNQRLSGGEINAALSIIGHPIISAIPTQIEANLLDAFPDLAVVEAHIAFPNRVIVSVTERMPLIAWYQNGTLAWIDSDGVAFPPRGQSTNLINIIATGNPPQVQPDLHDANAIPPSSAFMEATMVQAILNLSAQIPEGGSMIYDTTYGLGWEDLRGWKVFFGQKTDDVPLKQKVYQAIVATLANQGIHPSLISVEYPDAPFYRMDQ